MTEWWERSTFSLKDLVHKIRFVKEDQKAISYSVKLRDDESLQIEEFGTHNHGKCFTILLKRKYFNKVKKTAKFCILYSKNTCMPKKARYFE